METDDVLQLQKLEVGSEQLRLLLVERDFEMSAVKKASQDSGPPHSYCQFSLRAKGDEDVFLSHQSMCTRGPRFTHRPLDDGDG